MKKNYGNLFQSKYKNVPADFNKEQNCGPPLQKLKFTPSTELMNSDLPLEFKFSFFFSSAE